MFGLLKRGPKPPNYLVWKNNAARWSGIWPSIKGRTGDSRLVFVAHFDETLAVLHELLEQEGLVAHELTRSTQTDQLCQLPPGIYAIRAALIQRAPENKVAQASTALKIIAIEPHFVPEPDAGLKSVLDPIRGDVMFEHHASLDDPAIRLFAGEGLLDLMTKIGFNEDDYLNSPMISRALTQAQMKIAQTPGIDPAATSFAVWEAQLAARGGA
jgi:hypothetical protein